MKRLLFAILLALVPLSATADSTDSPIRILEVRASTFTNPQQLFSDPQAQAAISFENISTKTVTAVKWNVQLVDAFGTVIYTYVDGTYGKFAAGIPITGKAMFTMEHRPADHVNVVVAAVRFEDGSVWTNPQAQQQPAD